MPASSERRDDTLLDLAQGGQRSGYSADWLRRLALDPDNANPPPLFKLNNGRWRVWRSDLDAWIESQRAAS